MNQNITRLRFNHLADNLIKEIIPKIYHESIDFQNLIREVYNETSQSLSYQDLMQSSSANADPIKRAFIKRIILSDYTLLRFSNNEPVNTQFVWRLIFDSLIIFTNHDNSASVGSQGFVSIELYRYETKSGDRKILRLHIWHESFTDLFKSTHLEKYVIHSHLYNAQSHVLSGTLINKRFKIDQSDDKTGLVLNKIVWKDNSNKKSSCKRTSNLETEMEDILITELSCEEVYESQSYNVSVNEFHSTKASNSLTATLFLFDSSKGRIECSKVVGPKNDISTKFEYNKIDILPLLYQIDQKIKKQFNQQKLLALDWMRKIHTLEHAHRIESRHLKFWSEILSWSMVIIPAITAGLSIILKSSSPELTKDKFLILIAITAGLSTLIGTILRVMQPGKSSETHRINSERFEHLRHKIESHIVFHHDERLEIFLEEVRKEWGRLTLFNVKEDNFKAAQYLVGKLGKYPENLGFLENRYK